MYKLTGMLVCIHIFNFFKAKALRKRFMFGNAST